jgi:hypothetical protein
MKKYIMLLMLSVSLLIYPHIAMAERGGVSMGGSIDPAPLVMLHSEQDESNQRVNKEDMHHNEREWASAWGLSIFFASLLGGSIFAILYIHDAD